MNVYSSIKKLCVLSLCLAGSIAFAAPLYLECSTPDTTFKVTLDESAQKATYYNIKYSEHVFQAEARFTEDRVVYSAKDAFGITHEIDRRTLGFKMRAGPFNNGEGSCKLVSPGERKF